MQKSMTTKVQSAGLRTSLDIQRRVVFALVMREVITRYGRHNLGFLWLLLEPMIFTLGVAAIWQFFGASHRAGISPWSFALTGYSVLLLWRNCTSRTLKAIEPNLSLMFHINVRPLDIYLARIALEIMGVTTSFFVLSVTFFILDLVPVPTNKLGILEAWFILAWYATGLSMTVGALSEMSDLIDRVWHIFVYLLFPVSGAVFMVDWLSSSMREMVLYVPTVHITEMLRESYMASVHKAHYDMSYMLAWCLVLTFSGLFSIRKLSKKMEI